MHPEEYLLNQILQKEIKKNSPNRNIHNIIRETKDYYFNIELLLRKLDHTIINNEDIFKCKIDEELENSKDFNESNNEYDKMSFINNENFSEKEKFSDKGSIIERKKGHVRNKSKKKIKVTDIFREFTYEELNEYRGYKLENINQNLIDLFNQYNIKAYNLYLANYSNNNNNNITNLNINNTININNNSINNINIKGSDKYIIITENETSFSIKRDFYKSIFKYFEKNINYTVINTIIKTIRNTDDYINNNQIDNNNNNININSNSRKTSLIEDKTKKSNKESDIKNNDNNNIEKNTTEIKLGNLAFEKEENYILFNKWISSIFQLIKDIKLMDIDTNKEIIYNIYPQKDNIPTNSKTGKYWIKLYHMGKSRKIEIDDRQPCSINDEYLLPQSEKFTEIWPALFTKAIIKLYSYKFKNISYNEIGDVSILYSLTGYYIDKISTNSVKGKIMESFFDKFFSEANIIENNLSDKYLFLNKINALSCIKIANENVNFNSNIKYINNNNNTVINNDSISENPNAQKRNFKFTFKILEEEREKDEAELRMKKPKKIFDNSKPKYMGKLLKKKTGFKNKVLDTISKKISEKIINVEESLLKNTMNRGFYLYKFFLFFLFFFFY